MPDQAHRRRLPGGFDNLRAFLEDEIRVGRAQADKVPEDYRRRQTLKNAERYITPELKSWEDKVLSAQDRALAREKWLFEQLLDQLAPMVPRLAACAAACAELDAIAALAHHAEQHEWVAPDLDERPGIDIDVGRHPVVERTIERFTPNSCLLNAQRAMLVVTGPNMGGKSTYMRQVALIALLARAGSFVPARAARIGPLDRIFTRIGAADDLAGGRSTFMMEMTEASAILAASTTHSLVLMDEIGRGTSTFDGLALAGAIASHLHDRNGAFTLFATHYFELTALALKHERAINVHVAAVETRTRDGDDIVFLHQIEPGPASRSYGVQVARLAGMPATLLRQARAALEALESQQKSGQSQIDLFAPAAVPETPEPSALDAALAKIDPDSLTPKQALDALYRLKALQHPPERDTSP